MTTENIDRGDDFTPTPDDPKDAKAALELKELEKDAANGKSKDNAGDESDDTKNADDSGYDEDLDKAGLSTKSESDEDTSKEDKQGAKEDLKDEKERSKSIPRVRFDKAQEKAKAREEALQARISELEKATVGAKTSADVVALQKRLDELQDNYEELILDGKKAEARAVRKDIGMLQNALFDVRTSTASAAAKREAVDELKYDAALAKAEVDHPVLNPDSEEFDSDVTDEVGLVLESLILRGFTRDVALSKAVKYVVGNPAPKGKDEDETKKTKEARAEAARRKAADADKRQSPSLNKTGLDSDKGGLKSGGDVDVMRMSQEKFAKLDEETKARLRGDIL